MLPPPLGRLQHRWDDRFCLSVREGRGETSVPVILSQEDCVVDDEPVPPHMRPEQEVGLYLPSSKSWRVGQEFPLAHCTLDGFHSSTTDPDPEMMKPGIMNKCQATLKLNIKMLTDRQSA